MAFKSDRQRKAVMAKLNSGRMRKKNMSYSQAVNMGLITNPKGDADKDGVINKKDCKPFDAKKQGFLHDLQVKRLRRLEEKLEKKREKEKAKLEDIKDRLKERQAVSGKKQKIKTLQLKQKQAIIDEINREKAKAQKFREANAKAKAKLDKITVTGRAKVAVGGGVSAVGRGSVRVLSATARFLSKQLKK